MALKSIKNRWSKIDGVVMQWLGFFLIKIWRWGFSWRIVFCM